MTVDAWQNHWYIAKRRERLPPEEADRRGSDYDAASATV